MILTEYDLWSGISIMHGGSNFFEWLGADGDPYPGGTTISSMILAPLAVIILWRYDGS